MPLKQGYSKKTTRENTERLIREGRDPKQAYAIAKDIERKNRPRKGGKRG